MYEDAMSVYERDDIGSIFHLIPFRQVLTNAVIDERKEFSLID